MILKTFLLTGIVSLLLNCGSGPEKRRIVFIEEDGGAGSETGDVTNGGSTTTGGTNNEGGEDPTLPVEPEVPEGTTLKGAIVRVSTLGIVDGWAIDTENLMSVIDVTLFIDGDEASGTEIGSVQANLDGFDDDNEGAHRFSFELPVEYRDGVNRKLFVVLKDSEQEGLLNSSGFAFTSYSPSEDGEAYYVNSVRPALNGCAGCHNANNVPLTYASHFPILLNKPPSEGGTATNNKLIEKAAGVQNHAGGNACGGINNGGCAEFQAWWNVEFGG